MACTERIPPLWYLLDPRPVCTSSDPCPSVPLKWCFTNMSSAVLPVAEKDEVTSRIWGIAMNRKGILLIVHSLHWSPTYSLLISIENVPQLQSGKTYHVDSVESTPTTSLHKHPSSRSIGPTSPQATYWILAPPNLPIAK